MKERTDRRASQRYDLMSQVKFLLRGSEEGAGDLLNVSECGLALTSSTVANDGDKVVLYTQGLGRISGQIARVFEGGFAVTFELTDNERADMRDRIAAAIEGLWFSYLDRTRRRKALRMTYNIETEAQLECCDEPVQCALVDMSRSGARIRCVKTPRIGSHVVIGALHGVVVRHCEDGFAVEFFNAPHQPENARKVDHHEHKQFTQ